MTSIEPVDWIHLSKVKLPCVLGVFPWERRRRQTLEVEIGISLNLDAAAGGDLSNTVDYGAAFEQVRFIARHGRWPLVESLAIAIARHLLSPPAPGEQRRPIEQVLIRLCKPEALQGRAFPSIELRRSRSWCTLHAQSPPAEPVQIESLQETADTAAYHVDIQPGSQWTTPDGHIHVIAGRIGFGARTLRPGDVLGAGIHTLSNQGPSPVRLLLVAEPRFVRSP